MANTPVTPKAYHNWPKYDDDLVNKIYVDQKVSESSLDDGLEMRVENIEYDITQIDNSIININNNKLDTSQFDNFIQEEYNPLVNSIDKKIETWSQSTDPANLWTTLLERESHLGDIWYDTSTQKTYTYQKDSNVSPVVYYWQWQNVPIELLNTLNGKSTIYSGIIPSNYSSGDFWIVPLTPYNNTSSIISQIGDFVPEMIITLEEFTLEVLTVDAEGNILTYDLDIPATSNFSFNNRIIHDLDNISIQLISTSQFAIPTDCYGGSIAMAIRNNTAYDVNDWIKRSNPIPEDKSETYYASKQTVDGKLIEMSTETQSQFNNLGDALSLSVQTINNTIIENKLLVDADIEDLSEYTQTNINDLIESDEQINTYISQVSTSLTAQLQILSDSIISTIKKTGGNNLLRNSVAFKNRHFWTILGTHIYQQYNTSYGSKVTISFKFKKLTADLVVITLNRNESDYDTIFSTSAIIEDWTEFEYDYIATINNPYIKFNSLFVGIQDNDAESNGVSGSKLVFDNGLVMTDLIINYGDAQPWSPHFDEIYGKSHSLDSNGLDLLDLASGKSSHTDSNSLDFLNSDGNIEAVFSKAATMSDNYQVNNSLNIGNLRIMRLDDNNILEY